MTYRNDSPCHACGALPGRKLERGVERPVEIDPETTGREHQTKLRDMILLDGGGYGRELADHDRMAIAWIVRRAEAAEREMERWRHGRQIEGDYVCPNELRAVNAESHARELEAYADHRRPCPASTDDVDAPADLPCTCGLLAALSRRSQ